MPSFTDKDLADQKSRRDKERVTTQGNGLIKFASTAIWSKESYKLKIV